MSSKTLPKKVIYGPNFQKAKRQAIARSGGKCQLCGLRKAEEGHHWAWPNYPSDEKVQGHDITALCKPCHEYASLLRDWVGRKGASLNLLAMDLDNANNFFAKREIFSYWLFPKDEEKTSFTMYGATEERHKPVSYESKRYVSPQKESPSCLGVLIAIAAFLGLSAIFANMGGF